MQLYGRTICADRWRTPHMLSKDTVNHILFSEFLKVQ